MDNKTLATLRQAVELSPDNVPLRRHLATLLIEAGLHEEAREEYETALKHEPHEVSLLLEAAELSLQLNRYEEAAARLTQALRTDDKNAPALVALTRALIQLDQLPKAQRAYQQAMDVDPTLQDPDLEKQLFPSAPENSGSARPQLVHSGPEYSEFGEDFDAEEEDALQIMGLQMERPQITFANIGGMDVLKEEIRVNIIYPFQHPEIYKAYGKKTGGGILLYGPPGCGKTHIARATAGECEARFVAIGIEDVLDMWAGQSERKLHLIFEAGRTQSPSVLFFDELDALAGKRSEMSHSPHARGIVNQLLSEMDGAKGDNRDILIVGATNSPWHIDPAFRRPGRFDKVIFVPPPDLKARIEILKIHCEGKPVQDLDHPKVAARMKRFSGADIAAVCEAAAEIGLRETLRSGQVRQLTTKDFLTALKTIRPTTDEWLASAKNYAMYANQTGLYDAIAQYLQGNHD